MPILVDGHNLIGQLPTLSLHDPDDEAKLILLLRSHRARTGKALTVVFDPGGAFSLPQVQRSGGVEVVFAPHGSSADAVIRRRVQRSRNPSAWLVVTSDRSLAEVVGRLGARVQSAEAFAAALSPLQEPEQDTSAWKDAPPSPAEVDAWLAMFENRD